MNRVIAWFAANGVAANILMWLLIIVGIVTLSVESNRRSFRSSLPTSSRFESSTRVPHPKKSKRAVVIRIEEKIQDLPEIKEIRSTAAENMGTVLVEAVDGADLQKLLNDVKSRVDSIDTFPVDAEEPIVEAAVIRRQVLDVAISGDTDERSLKRAR